MIAFYRFTQTEDIIRAAALVMENRLYVKKDWRLSTALGAMDYFNVKVVCLAYDTITDCYIGCSILVESPEKDGPEVMCYVKRSYRRQYIGRRLVHETVPLDVDEVNFSNGIKSSCRFWDAVMTINTTM